MCAVIQVTFYSPILKIGFTGLIKPPFHETSAGRGLTTQNGSKSV